MSKAQTKQALMGNTRDRRKAAGFRQIAVYVHDGDRERLAKYAAKLAKARGGLP